MKAFFLSRNGVLTSTLVFTLVNAYLIAIEQYFLLALPLVMIIGYLIVFRLDLLFLTIVFCTPLSFNFENLDLGGVGFYFPTEPLLLIITIIYFLKF